MVRIKAWLGEWGSTVAVATIVLVFAFQGYSQSQANAKFRSEASHAKVVACAAVKQSNDAVEAFLRKEVGPHPTGRNAQIVQDLHDAYLTAEIKCLTGGGS